MGFYFWCCHPAANPFRGNVILMKAAFQEISGAFTNRLVLMGARDSKLGSRAGTPPPDTVASTIFWVCSFNLPCLRLLQISPDLVCTFWTFLGCLHVSLVLRLACETHLGEISIQSFGPENGPVVIAIHGILGEASRFCRTFASTSHLEFRVLCWTLPL